MPKLKSHRGAKKRIKVTSSGKLMRRRAFRGHLLAKKGGARKRNYSKDFVLKDSDRIKMKRNLGL